MNAIMPAAAIAGATGILSCLGTRGLIPLLSRRGMLDRPNERSSHTRPTPRGGGLAVIAALLIAWAALALFGEARPAIAAAMLGALLLAAVSWIDDLGGLSQAVRLAAQFAAAAFGLLALPAPAGALAALPAALLYPAILLLWVWGTNLFNFMDGIDGIAGGEAAAIGLGLVVLFAAGAGGASETGLLGAALLGAAVGFLVWNWPPARVFLGDVGSVPLGYLIGFLLLGLALRGHWRGALILPLYFLADASLTLARRLSRGERIWQAHREHFYQRAVSLGLSHGAVTRRVLAADLMLILCAAAAEAGWGRLALVAAGIVVVALLAELSRGR
ncbi:MAG TPA: glycosyltransferase family 4 protein [Stellaceae bacterium]|nr:glycosyltransferase family 4 protein [Stellaceae bacterium]